MKDIKIKRTVRRAILEAVEPRRLMSATLDATFGSAGVVNYADGNANFSTAASVTLAGGKVLSVSESADVEGQLALRRFNADGSPDASFGTSGAVTLTLGTGDINRTQTTALAAGANGSVFVAGEYDDPNNDANVGFVAHILANGSLDAAFGNSHLPGLAFFQPAGRNVTAPHLEVAADGGLYVGYTLDSAFTQQLAVTHLDATGTPIESYSNGGTAIFSIPGGAGELDRVALHGSSLLLVGHTYKTVNTGPSGEPFYSYNDDSLFLAQLDAGGTLTGAADDGTDGSADGFGLTPLTPNGQFTVDGLAATVAGGFIVGGNVHDDSGTHPTFLSFNSALAHDATFGTGGITTLASSDLALYDFDRYNAGVALDAVGNIYGVGNTTDSVSGAIALAVVRLKANGTLDSSFDGDGVYTLSQSSYDTANTITPDAKFVTGTTLIDGESLTGVVLKLTGPVIAPPPPTNSAPTVSSVTATPGIASRGQAVTFSATFTDPDTADTFQVSWNFGDGTVLPYTATTSKSVAVSHAFANAGSYAVTLSVKDSAGHVSTSSGSVSVVPYTLVNGQFGYTGSAGSDSISVTRNTAGALVLTDGSTSYTVAGPVTGIVIDGGAGNDLIRVSTQFTIPATLIGGVGNDTLRGGNGADVLIGDADNDTLIGRNGRDLLVGGTGADLLIGNEQDDILISGTTSYASTNYAAYSAIQAEWNSSRSYINRVANLSGLVPPPGLTRANGNYYLTPYVNVFDDTSIDTLAGGAGDDLPFFTFFGTSRDIYNDSLTSFSPSVQALITGD